MLTDNEQLLKIKFLLYSKRLTSQISRRRIGFEREHHALQRMIQTMERSGFLTRDEVQALTSGADAALFLARLNLDGIYRRHAQ